MMHESPIKKWIILLGKEEKKDSNFMDTPDKKATKDEKPCSEGKREKGNMKKRIYCGKNLMLKY